MRAAFIICFYVLIILSPVDTIAQDYFKTLDSPENYLNQKIVRFSNGDILIGDSSLEALNTGEDGKIFLTKMDNCGQLQWSYAYETSGQYIELRDLRITADDDVIAFGSSYQGFDERVFFLKVNSHGTVKRFKRFETGTVDHFTYNITIKGNQLMAYGLLLDWNVQKQGFVALFDDELNYQWGKRFTPFVTGGEAIFSLDNGFLCRSGKYIYKLTSEGELDWASINISDVPAPVAGPIAASGGYIFESTQNNLSFFFKLDSQGNLLWTSAKFPSTAYAADLKIQENGDLLAVYSCPNGAGNDICYLLLSPNGEIIQQRKLVIDKSFSTGDIDQTISEEGYLTIVGNAAIPPVSGSPIKDFLLQADTHGNGNDCFHWEDFEESYSNDSNPNFIPLDTAINDLNMSLLENQISIEQINIESIRFNNECDLSPDGNQLQVDTLLQCGENWLVTLPSEDFIWLDNGLSTPRLLEEVGSYRASNVDCTNPISYTYTLEREPCRCEVFLPNAVSPNNDGQNDQLSLFSNCTLSAFEIAIYSRWGDKLVSSTSTNFQWDGTSNGQAVSAGLYLVIIRYELMDEVGELQAGEVVQEVMVLR